VAAAPCCPRLHRYLLEVAHVALVSGDVFGAPTCMRMSYAAALPMLDEAMRRVALALAPEVFRRRRH